jgi:mycothiol synthase
MRPYAGEADLEAIAHLINTCEVVDQTDSGTSVSELRQSFNDPSVDKAHKTSIFGKMQRIS